MRYTLERPRTNQFSTEKIVAELRRVAGLYGNRHFSRREFDEKATDCKGSVVLKRFGSWQAALDAVGLKLEKVKKDRSHISNEQFFEELSRAWQLLGHRPSKDKWEKFGGKYSYATYKIRFKGWVSACVALIEYTSSQNQCVYSQAQIHACTSPLSVAELEIPTEEKRNIPMKLQYRVLNRDNYNVFCAGVTPQPTLVFRCISIILFHFLRKEKLFLKISARFATNAIGDEAMTYKQRPNKTLPQTRKSSAPLI